MEMIEVFHTSDVEIVEIKEQYGLFNEFLFFSWQPYSMSSVCSKIIYKMEIDKDSLISAGSLFYDDDYEKLDGLVEEFCEEFGVEKETAEYIISEAGSVYEFDNIDTSDGSAAWKAQLYTARAAKILGYRGVIVTDEQGTAYMIDMLGKESDLIADGVLN